MNRVFLILAILFVFLSACAPPVTDSEPSPTDTVEPEPTDLSDEEPEPKKDQIVRDLAPVEEVQVMLLESFPVQVNVAVQGYVPDACTEIGEITQVREGDIFEITIVTLRPADMLCAEVIEPFEEIIALDVVGLEAGVYTVDVNGVTRTFELQTDNKLSSGGESDMGLTPGADLGTDDKGKMEIGRAPVEQVVAELVSTDPLQAQARVVGYLPDGCTELGEMEQKWVGDTLYVTLTTRRPMGAMCITVITPFEQVIPLDTSGLSTGTFEVEVNGVTASLRVP